VAYAARTIHRAIGDTSLGDTLWKLVITAMPKTLSRDSTPQLTVRRLSVDLSTPMRRHWNGGDAFLTAFFNALSFSFPEGEQFFIESVRCGAAHPDAAMWPTAFQNTIKDFIGQEATHRHLHAQYNQQLEAQGLKNHWEQRIVKRKTRARRLFSKSSKRHLHELAITAGYEHFTSVLGELTLESIGKDGDWLQHADTPLQTLWRWHAAEECEHKAVAFDVYQQLGGNHTWRLLWFVYLSIHFTTDVIRQTINNLWHDRSLHQPSTWLSAFKFCFGRHGWVWRCTPRFMTYLRKDFHPNQMGDARLMRDWLQTHSSQWRAVGTPPP
jgi:predicted metal-dependent hydrolase